jgi:hypothetical protein
MSHMKSTSPSNVGTSVPSSPISTSSTWDNCSPGRGSSAARNRGDIGQCAPFIEAIQGPWSTWTLWWIRFWRRYDGSAAVLRELRQLDQVTDERTCIAVAVAIILTEKK